MASGSRSMLVSMGRKVRMTAVVDGSNLRIPKYGSGSSVGESLFISR